MGIVFFCRSCGARFEVDLRMAGKRGHCKKCGQQMTIPRADERFPSVRTLEGALAACGSSADRGPNRADA
jgi:hypothetical protein